MSKGKKKFVPNTEQCEGCKWAIRTTKGEYKMCGLYIDKKRHRVHEKTEDGKDLCLSKELGEREEPGWEMPAQEHSTYAGYKTKQGVR